MSPALSGRAPSPALAGWARSLAALLIVAVAALAVRGLVAMPRRIPSESMLPALLPGDLVLVERWRTRVLGRAPMRGDIVVLRAPDGEDYVKRVIGLPGDRVALRAGAVVLNGRALPRVRIGDFAAAVSPALACHRIDGTLPGALCRLPRFAETLPGGARYAVIDQGTTLQDEIAETSVPPGHYFLLGDNRDLSLDSRFTPAQGGIGLVPAAAIEGRVTRVLLSTDGDAHLRRDRVWIAP